MVEQAVALPPPSPPQLPATQPHLVIGMNTIDRARGEEYLTRTLDSLSQHIGESEGKINPAPQTSVLVLDPRGNPGRNRPFQANQMRLGDDPHYNFESKDSVKDPFVGHQEPKDPNSSDIPGAVGRQHTCDIVTLLDTTIQKFPTCDYFMFMEDDFVQVMPCLVWLLLARSPGCRLVLAAGCVAFCANSATAASRRSGTRSTSLTPTRLTGRGSGYHMD